MVMKVSREAKSFAKYLAKAIHWFWEACLPSRRSLLMSWCNPSEKGVRENAQQATPVGSNFRSFFTPIFPLSRALCHYVGVV